MRSFLKHIRRLKIAELKHSLQYFSSVALVATIVSYTQVAQAAVTITDTSSKIFYMDDDNTPQLRGMYVSYKITNTGAAISDAWVKLDMPAFGTAGFKVTRGQYEDGVMELGAMAAGETKTAFFYVYTPQAMAGQNSSLAISEPHTVRVYEGNPSQTGIQLSSSTFTFTEIQDTIDAAANKVSNVTTTTSQSGDTITVQVSGDAGTIGSPPNQSFSPAVFPDWRSDVLQLVSSNIAYGSSSFRDQLLFQFSPASSTYTATYVFKVLGSTSGSIALSPVGEIASGAQVKHTNTGNFSSFTLAPIAAPGGVTLSGTVWHDIDGSANNSFTNIKTGTEVGTNAGGLNAILVNSASQVIATTSIAANGTYTFTGISSNQSNVTLRLSTTAGTVGQTAPAVSIPANWINTSPLTTAAFNIGTSNLTGQDFGIEQPPNTDDKTATSQTNPGGTNTVQVPSLSGLDPEDGTLGTGKSFKLNPASNGTLYYNGSTIATPTAITNYDPAKLTIDPIDGSVTASFTYAAIDAAGKEDPTPATVTMPFTAPISLLTISGRVWDDANGDLTLNATETGTNAGGLNAFLVDSAGKVIAVASVASDGTYSFNNLTANQNNLTILISTNSATVGANAPAALLPTGWMNTTSLTTAPFSLSTTSITNKNFGIEQLPNTNNVTAVSQLNPGGTNTVQVAVLSGSDPEDGTIGSGQSFKIVTLPTNGTLFYSGVAVTAGQVITNYNPTQLTIDPNDGTVTVSFTYAAIDAAGKDDPTPATVTMRFTTSATTNSNVLLVKRITAINGGTTTTGGDDLAIYKDDPTNPYDDNTLDSPAPTPADTNQWVNLNTFLIGGTKGGNIRPGDEIEYTIYFLSTGDDIANNVLLCDRIPTSVTFSSSSFNSFANKASNGLLTADRGIQALYNGTTQSLTNVNDGDFAEYFPPGVDPRSVYPTANCGGSNINGAIVVNLGNLPNAIAPGSPTSSYGWVRFRGRAK